MYQNNFNRWAGGTNIATFVVIGEITIEPTRVTCMTYGNVVLWTTSWLVGYLPPYLKVLTVSYNSFSFNFFCFEFRSVKYCSVNLTYILIGS